VQQVSYGPLIMSIMLIMSCYTGFFNVRRGWQSLNTGPQFYLRLIQRTGWLSIYTCHTTDGRSFKPKKLSVPFLYHGVDPFLRTSASRTEKPGAYSTPGTPSGRGQDNQPITPKFVLYNPWICRYRFNQGFI